jgi:hypothetical protein
LPKTMVFRSPETQKVNCWFCPALFTTVWVPA